MSRDMHTRRIDGRIAMIDDPIVKEVRRIRDELAAKFNYDIDAIMKDAMQRQYSSGHKLVSFEHEKEREQMVKEPQPPYGSAYKK